MLCFLFISRHYPPSVTLPHLEVTAVSTESPDSLFTFYQQFIMNHQEHYRSWMVWIDVIRLCYEMCHVL